MVPCIEAGSNMLPHLIASSMVHHSSAVSYHISKKNEDNLDKVTVAANGLPPTICCTRNEPDEESGVGVGSTAFKKLNAKQCFFLYVFIYCVILSTFLSFLCFGLVILTYYFIIYYINLCFYLFIETIEVHHFTSTTDNPLPISFRKCNQIYCYI